ncbi:MAG: dihydropteroate synthase, partial [Candidatus Nanopelagicales bacterium]
EAMFALAAEFDATVILCYVKGANVREITDVNLDADPVPGILDHFAQRVEVARQHGVDRIVIDPGMGFYYGNLVDPMTRVRHQAEVIINTFRLRVLGLPICHALPHAFDLFEDHFRTAEGFFAVLATLGGASLFRTHEVPRVAAVVRAMQTLDVGTHWQR